jgi:hypothetical protein
MYCRFGSALAGSVVLVTMLTSGQAAHASIVNLIENTSGSINNALFFRADFDPGGTGALNPFVRVQHDNGPSNNGHSLSGREQGYNTSGRPVQYDENTDPNFTRDLLFGEVPIVIVNSVAHKELILDINEPLGGTQRFLSLDQVNIYSSDTGGQTGLQSTLGDLRFTTGAGLNDNTVLMDASLTSGSGEGDMRMFIPLSNFAGVANDDFIYLYSHFGNYGEDYRTGAGFEEWSVLPVPGPGVTALMVLAGAFMSAGARRRRRQPAAGA